MLSRNNRSLLNRRDALKIFGGGAAALAGAHRLTVGRAQDAKVTLRYQNHWSKETDAHFEGMNWLYESFQAKNPNITIENILNPDSEESRKKILADCAAGDCPDIIHDAAVDMWDAGYLLDLTPYIDADPAWKAALDPNVLGTTSTEGKIWGLSGEVSPLPTIWNTRILEEAGIAAVPTTWDELLAACEAVKAKGYLPTSWEVGGSHQWHNLVASQAGGLDALAAGQFDAPELLEGFNRLKVFVDNGWVPDNEVELTWQQSVALFVAEKSAFYLNGAWTIGNEITGEGASPDLKDHVEFAPFPGIGENGSTVEIKQTTGIGLSSALAKNEAKLDAALTFFKYWFSEEGGKQWILKTRSPMGVNVDLTTLEGVDPLLMGFLGAKDKAQTAYSLPGTKAMQERGWDDCATALDTLLTGGSAEAAIDAYVQEMSKYKTT
ncbi:MAG: raffinose/stachyose/melibiose transport system substrate-binding protein [Thermomicrobiales bacterium]|jgi:raffinose/stachyose/melibiose transport system substrate-binding protein|nr:raffinose/stachyose/melibiose transport system substrate-binding protein [Thermomicrobiales bacterium]